MFLDEPFLNSIAAYTHDPVFQLDMMHWKCQRLIEKYYKERDDQAKFLRFRQLQELADLFSYVYNSKTIEDFYGRTFDKPQEEEEEFYA